MAHTLCLWGGEVDMYGSRTLPGGEGVGAQGSCTLCLGGRGEVHRVHAHCAWGGRGRCTGFMHTVPGGEGGGAWFSHCAARVLRVGAGQCETVWCICVARCGMWRS